MIFMAMKKRLFLIGFLVSMGMLATMAQTPTTQGKEFWLSFMRNGYRSTSSSNSLILIASAKHACTVTVSSPFNNSWSVSGTIEQNNGITTINIPDAMGYNDQSSGIANKGLFVQASDTISLYIANETQNSYDAANVLPLQALGCRYMVQTNKSLHYNNSSHADDNRASFLIVATEDNTQVQITPSCQTMDGHGDLYTISLQRGQCYHVLNKSPGYSNNPDGDFSGTLIESLGNKPIAVFNGNSVTSVTQDAVNEGYDHVFEQAMPVDYWGKRFVVTKSIGSSSLQDDRVKVTALLDSTNVWRDGELVYRNLASGESRAFWLSETNSYLESNSPVAVFLYNHSHSSSNTYSDPSMVWISPIEQTVEEVSFSTFSATNGLHHFVNIVCYSDCVAGMTLDRNNIASSFNEVLGAPTLSFARVGLEHGAHTICCSGGFIAHVYGNGERESYAYTVGSSAKDLTAQLFVDDIPADEFEGTCQNEEVAFRVETNYDIHHVEWDFGDFSGGEGVEVTHSYNGSHGSVQVTSVVFRDLNNTVQPFDTLIASFPVYSKYYNSISVFSCDTVGVFVDSLQTIHGCDSVIVTTFVPGADHMVDLYATGCRQYVFRDSIFTTSGIHDYLVPQLGCDSVYRIHLTIVNPQNDTIAISACWPYSMSFGGTTIIADTTGVYRLPCYTEEGCEYYRILYYTHINGIEVDTSIVACDSFLWEANGVVYEEGGDYDYEEKDENHPYAPDCSTYWHLHLSLSKSPPFNEIKGLGYVAVATNYWPGEYVYYVDDSTGMDTQLIEWELSDNENGEWELHPHGGSCTVITYCQGSKVLHARAYTDHDCGKDVFFTINCGGYDLEEMEDLPLKIYPNPAKEELVVESDEIKNVCLYNLIGQKVKETTCAGESVARFEVSDLPQALYLVTVFTGHGNKTQLVSVIK